MIDAFLSTCATEPLRLGLATATYACLSSRKDIALTTIRTRDAWLQPIESCLTLGVTADKFQRERRKQADICASTPIYLMADDDVLPMDRDFVEKGLEIMGRHPDFALIGLRERGVAYLPQEGFKDAEVEERLEAGGLYFIRKGILQKWPTPSAFNDYDFLEADALNKLGWKVGVFNQLAFNHIGLCFSTATWNESGYAVQH